MSPFSNSHFLFLRSEDLIQKTVHEEEEDKQILTYTPFNKVDRISHSFKTNQNANFHHHKTIDKIRGKTKMFKCDYCSYITKYENRIKNHVLSHRKGTKIFKCDQCSFITKRKVNCKVYSLLHKNIDEVKTFRCNLCSYITKIKSNLKRHSYVHRIEEEGKEEDEEEKSNLTRTLNKVI